MAKLNDILPKRLAETFNGETQQKTAKTLNIEQGTVSKWIKGTSVPPVETLLFIAERYHVSVDWLLGLSEEKIVDAVCIEKLTYEQISLMLHRLIELGIIEIPNLAQFGSEPSEDDEDESKVPRYDSDFIKINDRALSYIFRTRWKLYELGEEMMMEKWVTDFVKIFHGVQLLKYNEKTQAALDSQDWPTFKAGDWASTISVINKMSDSQIAEITKKKKDGMSYGR